MPTRDKKTKANDLSFEKSRERPIDHAVVRHSRTFPILRTPYYGDARNWRCWKDFEGSWPSLTEESELETYEPPLPGHILPPIAVNTTYLPPCLLEHLQSHAYRKYLSHLIPEEAHTNQFLLVSVLYPPQFLFSLHSLNFAAIRLICACDWLFSPLLLRTFLIRGLFLYFWRICSFASPSLRLHLVVAWPLLLPTLVHLLRIDGAFYTRSGRTGEM